MRSYKISANMIRKNSTDTKTFQQYDFGNKIEFELLEGALKIDLANKTVLTYWLKNGSTKPIEKAATVNSNGNVEVKTTQEILSASGELLMQILVIGNDEQARSQVFKFKVEESLNGDDAILEDPDYSSSLVTDLINLRDSVRAETIDKIESVEKKADILKKNTRIFRPKFGCTFYLGQANDLHGNYITRPLEYCKERVGGVIDYIDEVAITFHISYNEDTNKFYIVEDRQTMYDMASWIINEKGKTVPAIKMYAQRYDISHVESYGISNFHAKWKEFITEIGTKFNDLGVTYFAIHNEVTEIVGSKEHLPYLLEEIELAKSLGYKVAYDYAGGSHYNHTLPEFKEKLDAHFMNIYPPVTSLGVKATYNEVLNSFKNEPYLDIISKVHNDYPDADVIINECGVQDNWYALTSPENFNWSNVEASNGIAPAMYLQALLETTKDMDVKSVWWWYELSFDATRKVLNRYVRGEE